MRIFKGGTHSKTHLNMEFISKNRLECLPFYLASAPLFGFFIDVVLFRKKFPITAFFISPFSHSYPGGDGGLSSIFDIYIAVFFEISLIVGGLIILFLKHKKKEKISDELKLAVKILVAAVVLCVIAIIIVS